MVKEIIKLKFLFRMIRCLKKFLIWNMFQSIKTFKIFQLYIITLIFKLFLNTLNKFD